MLTAEPAADDRGALAVERVVELSHAGTGRVVPGAAAERPPAERRGRVAAALQLEAARAEPDVALGSVAEGGCHDPLVCAPVCMHGRTHNHTYIHAYNASRSARRAAAVSVINHVLGALR